MLRVFARRVTRTFHFRIRTIVLLKKKRENLHLERSQWDLVLIQKKTQIDWNILRLILLSIVFTSKKSKICCALFHSSRRDQNVRKKALKKRIKKECRLKSSISIEKVDQSRTRAMRVWFKKSLQRESCLNRRRTKEEQLLSWKRRCRLNLRRRFHFYRSCKCYLVD